MTKKHIYIYKNKNSRGLCGSFAKDLLENVTTFPQIDQRSILFILGTLLSLSQREFWK